MTKIWIRNVLYMVDDEVEDYIDELLATIDDLRQALNKL